MTSATRTNLVSLGFVVAGFVLAAALYDRLPDPVPTHWNLRGEADGFTAKPLGAFVMPLINAGLWLLLTVIPRLSPRGYRVDGFMRVYRILQMVMAGFTFVMTAVVLAAAAGAPVAMGRMVPVAVGLLLMVLGNYLGKVTKNFFVGIRTPWTLANDEVWLRTHRLGGKLFVAAGAVTIVAGLLGAQMVMLPALLVAAIVPVVYSAVIHGRIEEKQRRAGDDD